MVTAMSSWPHFFGRPCQQRAVCCAKRLCIRPTEIEPKFDTDTQHNSGLDVDLHWANRSV